MLGSRMVCGRGGSIRRTHARTESAPKYAKAFAHTRTATQGSPDPPPTQKARPEKHESQ